MGVAHKIYAQALVDAAKQRGTLARVREEFDDLAAVLEESRELANAIRNPQIDTRVKADVLQSVLGDVDESFVNFVRLLAEKNRIDQVDDVHREFERIIAAEERVLSLELTTAVELSDEEARRIAGMIEEASGRRVETVRRVDPSIIGGVVVQAGSKRVDASVRGRLNQLRHELATRS